MSASPGCPRQRDNVADLLQATLRPRDAVPRVPSTLRWRHQGRMARSSATPREQILDAPLCVVSLSVLRTSPGRTLAARHPLTPTLFRQILGRIERLAASDVIEPPVQGGGRSRRPPAEVAARSVVTRGRPSADIGVGGAGGVRTQRVTNAHGRYSLVLDVRIPGMTGVDLPRHLAANGSRVPEIMLIAHGDAETPVAMPRGRRGARPPGRLRQSSRDVTAVSTMPMTSGSPHER